jgi:hypothetical protein
MAVLKCTAWRNKKTADLKFIVLKAETGKHLRAKKIKTIRNLLSWNLRLSIPNFNYVILYILNLNICLNNNNNNNNNNTVAYTRAFQSIKWLC